MSIRKEARLKATQLYLKRLNKRKPRRKPYVGQGR